MKNKIIAVWVCAVLLLFGMVPLFDAVNRVDVVNVPLDDSILWGSLLDKYLSDSHGEAGLCLPDNPMNQQGGATRGILDPVWGNETTNTVVCTASGGQEVPQLIPDGQGGAIIAWLDYRGGNADIYAQRVNTTGSAEWSVDGVAVCTAANDQLSVKLVPDGQGGGIITWRDYRGGNWDIYAQRVNVHGVVQWASNGVAICTAIYGQYAPSIVPDGQGGAIITWEDYRSGSSGDIYAQRVNASGTVQWTVNGVAVCTAIQEQYFVRSIPDQNGGAIITWTDYRTDIDGDIYAQRVDATGARLWTSNGVAICTVTGKQSGYYYNHIAPDGSGGTFIAWEDHRNGYPDIYAQRIGSAGNALWAVNGVALCTATNYQEGPRLTPDGQGGAIVVWMDYRTGSNYDLYSQRVDGSGNALWTANGVAVCTASGDLNDPQLVPDGQGGAIIAWEDYRNGTNYDIYAQRVNMNGVSLWARDGLAICTSSGRQRNAQITLDSRWLSGNQQAQSPGQSNTANEMKGIIIVWEDTRNGVSNYDIYAQAINEDGKEFLENHALDPRWGNETMNTVVCGESNVQNSVDIAMDGQGGAVMVWMDKRNDSTTSSDIYAQRIGADGTVTWTAGGVPICTNSAAQMSPQIVPDGQGGAIIVWYDYRPSSYTDIYAQRIGAGGATLWTADGIPVCTSTDSETLPQLVADGQGGAIVSWMDYRGAPRRIYAQRIDASGALIWDPLGKPLTTTLAYASEHQMVQDGQGGAIIAWRDWGASSYDIFAQRIDGSGSVMWAGTGLTVCAAALDQYYPHLISDGHGGTIIAWDDYRNDDGSDRNDDVYAQRVDAFGAMLWTANGVAVYTGVADELGYYCYPMLVPDGQGGAIIVWEDYRDFATLSVDIYGQRLDANGNEMWTAGGEAICNTNTWQYYANIVPDGNGGALVVFCDWADGTPLDSYDWHMQRVDVDGTRTYAPAGLLASSFSSSTDPSRPKAALDGQGGLLVAWDGVRDSSATLSDIYAQRISLTQSTVVVNEVMHAPTSGNEWVELYNPSLIDYNISGWTLIDNSNAAFFTVPNLTVLAPGAYYVCDITVPSLDNDDWVALYDSDGIMRDYVCWGISEPFGATHDAAVLAQHWTSGTGFFVNTFAFVPGDSIGRDRNSNDSNSFLDWEITCGRDASAPTPEFMNLGAGFQNFEIVLVQGWNLISIPLAMVDTSIDSVLSSISGNWSVAKCYDGATKTWKTYRPIGTQTFTTIDHTMGVWVYINENCTLTINGAIPASTDITLKAGWNLVGYPSDTPRLASEILPPEADMVSVYQTASPYIQDFTDLGLVNMSAGNGYWVHVSADTVWVAEW